MVLENRESAGALGEKSNSQYVPLKGQIEQRTESRDHWFSLEFFPPRTEQGAANLVGRYIHFLVMLFMYDIF